MRPMSGWTSLLHAQMQMAIMLLNWQNPSCQTRKPFRCFAQNLLGQGQKGVVGRGTALLRLVSCHSHRPAAERPCGVCASACIDRQGVGMCRLVRCFGLTRRCGGSPLRWIDRCSTARKEFSFSLRRMTLSSVLSLLGCHYFACLLWWTLRLEKAPARGFLCS